MDGMVQITNRRIGPNEPAFLVAEMAWAHDGSIANAIAIARAAVDARCDALDIHLTSLPDYMVKNYGAGPGVVSAGHETESVFDYLSRISLPAQAWEEVAHVVHGSGLALSCMLNDLASLSLSDRLEADLLMVPPACVAERRYLEAVAERAKPVMIGVGGAQIGEIESALEVLARNGGGPMVLQYGIQSYPTDPRALNLRYLATLRKLFGLPVLYHDHTEAGSALATEIPLVALGLGAAGIEKHVTHSRSARGEDFESALEPEELKGFTSAVRTAEAALGRPGIRDLSEAEVRYRRVVRKRATAATVLPRGTLLELSSVTFKRADEGLYPDELERFLGRRTRVDLNPEDPIRPEVLD